MNDLLQFAAATLGGILLGAGGALFFADRIFRKAQGSPPAPALPWWEDAAGSIAESGYAAGQEGGAGESGAFSYRGELEP